MKDGNLVIRSHEEIEKLVNRLKKDDLDALGELYEVYSDKLFRRCFFLLKDAVLAEDAVHDLFIKVLANVKGISDSITFDAWINRTVYNHCIDILRKQQKTNSKTFEDHDETENNLAEVIEAFTTNEKLNAALRQKLDELNEIDRTILSMHYWEGYSVKEIAEQLEMGESAVKMRMKRTRDGIKEKLKNDTTIEELLPVLVLILINVI